MYKKAMTGTIGKRSPLAVLCANTDSCSMDIAINVHGGVTYSKGGGQFPVPDSDHLWWIGFDCAHCDDTVAICDEAYVRAECELLAEQLWQVIGWNSPDR